MRETAREGSTCCYLLLHTGALERLGERDEVSAFIKLGVLPSLFLVNSGNLFLEKGRVALVTLELWAQLSFRISVTKRFFLEVVILSLQISNC